MGGGEHVDLVIYPEAVCAGSFDALTVMAWPQARGEHGLVDGPMAAPHNRGHC